MIMEIAVMVFVFMLAVEVMFWSFSINRHAVWLMQHPNYDRRMAVPSKILAVGGWFTAILALCLWFWHIHSFALHRLSDSMLKNYIIDTFFICWILIAMIHLWAMIARYGCLHTQYWPIISGLVSKMLIKKFGITDVNKHCTYMRRWNELDRLSEKHRKLVFKFADKMRDFIWTKDTKKRYTYVNKAMCDYILFYDQHDVIGLSHQQIATELREEGVVYNFDSVSIKSDDKVLADRELTRFVERGIIDNKEVTLHVLKAPIFADGEINGIIGVARDITFEVESLEKIELLFKSGDIAKGLKVFYKYKEDFMGLRKYKSHYIEKE